MRHFYALAVAVPVVVVLVTIVRMNGTGNDTHSLVQQAISADRLGRHRFYIARLLENASTEELRRYQEHSHDTIAISAAWELVRRSMSDSAGIAGVPEADSDLQFDERALREFLNTVEERLQMAAPEGWQTIVAELEPTGRGDVFVRYPVEIHTEQSPYREGESGINALASLDVNESGDGALDLTFEGYSYTVPPKVVRDAMRVYGRFPQGRKLVGLTGWMDRDFCVFGFHGFQSGDYTLECVKRESGESVWSCTVWGYNETHSTGDLTLAHTAEIRRQGDELVVFGADLNVVYIEGLSMTDGTSRFRFTTAYHE